MAKDYVGQGIKFVDRSLSFLENHYVKWGIIVFLILYAVFGAPLFPSGVVAVFQNPIVQFLFIVAIAYIGIKDLGVALALALAFVVSLYFGSRYGGGITALPSAVISTGQAAVGQAVGLGQQAVGTAANVAGSVVNTAAGAVSGVAGAVGSVAGGTVAGADMVGQEVASAANYLTGGLMNELDPSQPAGYNTELKCFASCDSLFPDTGAQCQTESAWDKSADVQGLSCPQQGFQGNFEGAKYTSSD